MASPKCYSSIWEPSFQVPNVPPDPRSPWRGWWHHPASSFEQMSRPHICDEASESREGRGVEPSAPWAEVAQAVPSLSMAGSFLQPDMLWVSVCFPITHISASPSLISLLPHHPHLCLPVTHISASPLPASRRCSLRILHELCDGHYVTSITAPPPPRSPSTPAPSSQMAAPTPPDGSLVPRKGSCCPA